MADGAPPSIDPANSDSLQGIFSLVLRKFLQGVDDMLPARVISYDRTANRALIQPMIAILVTDGSLVQRAQIASVPVFRFGGGGHVLSFNLKEGDLGWIKANDRDISLFAQSYSQSQPNTLRYHSFEDAMFFPDSMRDVTIKDEDEENVTLQTNDGKYRVTIWDDRIKLTADDTTVEMKSGEVRIRAPLIVALEAANIELAGNVTTGTGTGTPDVTMEASNSITLRSPNVNIDSPNIVFGGIGWQAHEHTNVQNGPNNSGGPTNP